MASDTPYIAVKQSSINSCAMHYICFFTFLINKLCIGRYFLSCCSFQTSKKSVTITTPMTAILTIMMIIRQLLQCLMLSYIFRVLFVFRQVVNGTMITSATVTGFSGERTTSITLQGLQYMVLFCQFYCRPIGMILLSVCLSVMLCIVPEQVNRKMIFTTFNPLHRP